MRICKARCFIKGHVGEVPRDLSPFQAFVSRSVGYPTLRDQPRRVTGTNLTIQRLEYALFQSRVNSWVGRLFSS